MDADHLAYGALGLGILRVCYQMVVLARPRLSFDFCPLVGAGRIFIRPVPKENQPNYIGADAHPFAVMTGLRLPVSWQFMADQGAPFYFRAYLEGDVGLLRNHVSFNNVPVWGDMPPFGLSIGLEFSIVVNPPRSWSDPYPEPVGATNTQTK